MVMGVSNRVENARAGLIRATTWTAPAMFDNVSRTIVGQNVIYVRFTTY